MAAHDPLSSISLFFRLACVLLLFDLGFIAVHIGFALAEPFGVRFPDSANLNEIRGAASTWNYGKFLFISAWLISLFALTRERFYVAVSALTLILFADDFFEIHDRVGRILGAMWLPDETEIGRLQDAGEPIVYAALLGIAVALIWIGIALSPRLGRRITYLFIGGIALLAMFGAAIDVIHGIIFRLVEGTRFRDQVFLVIEDGGEIVSVTVILVACLMATEHHTRGSA